jgi:ribosomal protection tetracycline resistance protein
LVSTLNLGIVAHVDAGKTSLTERLLYAVGVIDSIGRVDDGNTQTDSLALERARGITIKSAVVSFVVDDITINLIDTPGHPDFIAEVERVLSVLDGAVLVVSAVEGVQAQTRVLMRALRRLRIPTLVFVNKIDRRGADHERTLRDVAAKLTPSVVPMGQVSRCGTRNADFVPSTPVGSTVVDLLADHDDTFLADYLADDTSISEHRVRRALAAQSKRATIHPVYFGSAITGAGLDALIAGLTELLPTPDGDVHEPSSGTVFKVERGPAGEKIAYVRMFSGEVRTRDVLRFHRGRRQGRVTAIGVFDHGKAVRDSSVPAGRIGRLWGLTDVRIGDVIGEPSAPTQGHQFAPPTLETVVDPVSPADRGALHVALTQLAEQDPLINVRQHDRTLSVSLYGELQKEVIQATLADDYGLDVTFRETTVICVERVTGVGAAVEEIGHGGNPFWATVGLRIEPAPVDTGVTFRLEVELGSMPLAFFTAVEDTVRETLRQGRHGWQVTDCVVTMTRSGFAPPLSTAADFRILTPLVLVATLRRAGTEVCEPVDRFRLEFPADVLGAVLPVLARLRAAPTASVAQGPTCLLEGEIPAAQVHALHRRLPGLTRGEGVLECTFDHHRPVRGTPPARPHSGPNPFDRKEYLLHVVRRTGRSDPHTPGS